MNPIFTFFELPIAAGIIVYALTVVFKLVGILLLSWLSVLFVALLASVCCAFCACVVCVCLYYWFHS